MEDNFFLNEDEAKKLKQIKLTNSGNSGIHYVVIHRVMNVITSLLLVVILFYVSNFLEVTFEIFSSNALLLLYITSITIGIVKYVTSNFKIKQFENIATINENLKRLVQIHLKEASDNE